MIGSILVPVDASAFAKSATKQALTIAQAYRGQVTGLNVLDARLLEMPPYLDYSLAMAPTVLPLDVLDQYRRKSERILAEFQDEAAGASVEATVRTEEGDPSQVIADVGRTYDLIVMGKRGEHARWGRDLLGSTAESVVRRSGTPVLLCGTIVNRFETIMVLFDGSAHSSNALKLAADLAMHLSAKLRVFTADEEAEQAETVQAEARSYLKALQIEATYATEAGAINQVLPSALEDHPADLVVAGMRGHSAFHDLILGSAAEHMMRVVPEPVLLVP